jgi:hypothetical protein
MKAASNRTFARTALGFAALAGFFALAILFKGWRYLPGLFS